MADFFVCLFNYLLFVPHTVLVILQLFLLSTSVIFYHGDFIECNIEYQVSLFCASTEALNFECYLQVKFLFC